MSSVIVLSDNLVKSPKFPIFVMPAKPVADPDPGVGIEEYHLVMAPGFHRCDAFGDFFCECVIN